MPIFEIFSALTSSTENIDRYDPHKQKPFGVFKGECKWGQTPKCLRITNFYIRYKS